MLDALRRVQDGVHSVLVVCRGVTVLDACFYPHHPDALHDVRSITKTVTSILAGIAIDKGYIPGVGSRVLDFFPDWAMSHTDERKRAITLEHLLTMTSGLDWDDGRDMSRLFAQDDWVQFVLDRPMATDPGTHMRYATGPVHLISAILRQATGQSPAAFAQDTLFGPLGIEGVYWMSDPQGIDAGGLGLFLRPRDMAKIGLLFLNQGQWQGEQIVSPAWVVASTRAQHLLPDNPDTDYGYLWWVNRAGYALASGYAGQRIYVLPRLQTVAVFTGGLKEGGPDLPRTLLETYIIPAVESPGAPEPADRTGLHGVFDQPEPRPVPPLSPTAQRISGRTYVLEGNVFGWRTLRLDFADGTNTATVCVNDGPEALIGLDGVARVTPGGRFIHWLSVLFPAALRGGWETADTFAVCFQELGVPEPHDVRLTFVDDRVEVVAVEKLNDETTQFSGKFVGA